MIPLHIVTGFLGAGKTTLVNRLLRDPLLAETLVVINEVGSVGLDHRLVETLLGDVMLLDSGCLCCTLRGDFVEGLNRLIAQRETGETGRFRRIVVETSGLADPGPLLHALFADVELSAATQLVDVVAVVDAVNGAATLARHGEARRQVALADWIAVSKQDLAPDNQTNDWLSEWRPAAKLCNAEALTAEDFLAGVWTIPSGERLSARAAHGVAEAHAFTTKTPIPAPRLSQFLSLLAEFAGPDLLRVKGLVASAADPDRPWVIQGAQQALAPPVRLPKWPEGPRETVLVVIGEHVRARAERLWGALCGQTQTDAPDWAAVAENPLAPRRGGLF